MLNQVSVNTHQSGKRYRIASVAALFAAIAALLFQTVLSSAPAHAAGIFSCAGGSSSGNQSYPCPSLHNNDLLSEPTLPTVLYRGDSRTPYDIFRNGFTSAGTDYDLANHLHGRPNSGYVSTSVSLSVSETFARSQGGRNLIAAAAAPTCRTGRFAQWSPVPGLGWFQSEGCQDGWVTADSYVYLIDPTWERQALYIPAEVRGDALLSVYESQLEWAYVRHIPHTAIMGVRVYRMTARARNGYVDFGTATFTYDRYMGNSAHTEALIAYDPGADPNAHFSSTMSLGVPELPANPYTRGCSAIDRCRSGIG